MLEKQSKIHDDIVTPYSGKLQVPTFESNHDQFANAEINCDNILTKITRVDIHDVIERSFISNKRNGTTLKVPTDLPRKQYTLHLQTKNGSDRNF